MRFELRYLLLLLTLSGTTLFPLANSGQLYSGLDSRRHVAFLRSVKQLSEFIDRFNADYYELPDPDPDRKLVLDRRQSILLLFDPDDPRFDTSRTTYSQEYTDRVLRFADEVVKKGIYIDRFSKQIEAHVTASVLYRGEPDTMILILTREVDSPDLVRWVISDVEAEFLEIPGRDTTMLRFLSPVSHELGFMELSRAFREPEHLIDYTRREYEYDRLSVFLENVVQGQLRLMEVTGQFYVITIHEPENIRVKLDIRYGPPIVSLQIRDIHYLE